MECEYYYNYTVNGFARCDTLEKPTQCLQTAYTLSQITNINLNYYLFGNTCILNIYNCQKLKNSDGLCESCYNDT